MRFSYYGRHIEIVERAWQAALEMGIPALEHGQNSLQVIASCIEKAIMHPAEVVPA
jgi:hypothetical protein